jgi:hypothetical protein
MLLGRLPVTLVEVLTAQFTIGRPVPDLCSVLPERCNARGADPAARGLSAFCQAASAGMTPCTWCPPPFTQPCAFLGSDIPVMLDDSDGFTTQ